MTKPRVFIDFNNQDPKRRLHLSCDGSRRDLERQHLELAEGLVLTLYMDDEDELGRTQQIVVDGVVEYSDEEKCWVAVIDWDAIQYVPVGQGEKANGAGTSETSSVPSSPPSA